MILSRLIAPLVAAIGIALAAAGPASAIPGLTERVVSDPASGIALFGYDPVAYFTDGRPVVGSAAFETEWNGAAWRFESDANRAAFLSAPEVYAPKYGGYDPAAVAKGVAVAGHPLLFRVSGDRLYLFHTETDRDAFGDPGVADDAWPAVMAGLTD